MRLTVDPFEEPHAEAERCLQLEGRPLMAVFLLKEALKEDPANQDLRCHLKRLEGRPASHRNRLPGRPARGRRLQILRHQAVAWILLLLSLALPVLPAPVLAEFADADCSELLPASGGWSLVAALGLLSVLGFACGHGAIRLFLSLWFLYLSRLAPLQALLADKHLGAAANVRSLGNLYVRHRKDFFARRYGSRAGCPGNTPAACPGCTATLSSGKQKSSSGK